MPAMPWYYDSYGSRRWDGQGCQFAQLGIRVKHHVRRRRDAPQDIDFIVIVRMRSDIRTASRRHRVYMQMHKR
jgi:hypothetical protein